MTAFLGALLNKTPVSFVSRGSMPYPTMQRNDAESQMRQMGSVGTLFAIVHRISNSVAAVDWKLYRKNEDARRAYGPLEDRRVEVTRHLALDIWNNPNPFYTRQEFVESFTQHLDLTGEGYWVVARDARASFPMELWPVRPDRMVPVPHPTDFLTGWVYAGPSGEKVPLNRNEVVQLKMPNPLDPYRGMGPVQSLLVDLDSTRYSAQWNRNFFLNSAEPGGIIEVDRRLDDDEFNEMTGRWREQHQGVAQAHRVAVLEQGKWVERSFNQRDMQFVQLREVSRDIIREAFGMSKTMLGQTEDVNRATAEAAEYVFARYQLVSRLERIKGVLNNEFLPMFGPTGQGVEFDYSNPVPNDREATNAERASKASAAVQLVSAGYDPAEVLDTVGLPPMTFVGRGSGQAQDVAANG